MREALFPETFTPRDIDQLIGTELRYSHRHVIVVHITDDNLTLADDTSDLEERVLEEAHCHHERYMRRFPDNDFRYVSDLTHAEYAHYRFEVCLTMSGKNALACADKNLCCNRSGRFDPEETVRHWLERIYQCHVTKVEFNSPYLQSDTCSWIEESWAEPVRYALGFYLRGIATNLRGKPDYERTVHEWKTHLFGSLDFRSSEPYFTTVGRRVDTMRKGAHGTLLLEEWALPLRKAIDAAEQFILTDDAGDMDYATTVKFWLNRSHELLARKNHFLAIKEDWALPIQERLMVMLMKQERGRIYD